MDREDRITQSVFLTCEKNDCLNFNDLDKFPILSFILTVHDIEDVSFGNTVEKLRDNKYGNRVIRYF